MTVPAEDVAPSNPGSAGAARRILSSVGVRPDEIQLVGRLTALFFLVQASHGVGVNAAFALFFTRFGVEELPLMIVLSGPVVMTATLAHTGGLARLGDRRWLWMASAALSAWALFEWIAVGSGGRQVYPVVWISTQVLVFVSFTLIWNAAGSACDTRQAKRLFSLFATAGVAGGVVGNLVVGPLAVLFGTENLLLVQSLLLVGATFILFRSRRFLTAGDPTQTAREELTRAAAAFRSSKLLKLAALVVFASSILFFLVMFPFSEEVASAFETEEAMAGFLGLFSSVATAATFVFSLLITNRLFSRLGLVLTLLIVPAVYALGMGVWLISFGLVTATAVRGVQWVAVNAIESSGTSALFNVLPRRDRGPVMSLMTAIPAQLGTVAAGLILLASETLETKALFVIGLLLSVASVAAVAAMRPAYIQAVITAVRRGFVSIFDAPQSGSGTVVDGDIALVLEGLLTDTRPEARALAVAGLANVGDPTRAESVAPLLSDIDPSVRSAAFETMYELDPHQLDRHLQSALEDEAPMVRRQALHHIAEEPAIGPDLPIEPALSDPDERVRAAAAFLVGGERGANIVSQMLSSGSTIATTAVLDEVARFPEKNPGIDPAAYLDDPHPRVRAVAARALGALGENAVRLVPALDDSSLRVRTAAASSLARTVEGRSLLLDVLESGSVAATDATIGEVSSLEGRDMRLDEWAAREARRAAFLERSSRHVTGSTPEASFLTGVLEKRVRRLVRWILIAMTTERTRLIMPVVARGVRSDDPETRSQALEALESIGDRSVLSTLLPLLEDHPDEPADQLHRALESLSTDFDPWLSTLARVCLASADVQGSPGTFATDAQDVPVWASVSDEHTEIYSEIGRVLILQRVSMFADLDPEDLLLVSRQTTEVHYGPGDLIYGQGDPGDQLIVITRGEAVVSTIHDGERVVVTNYGEGETIGELALFTNRARSADVNAGPDGLDGLVMTQFDVVSIVEERPSVAMGLLGMLASRLSDQT